MQKTRFDICFSTPIRTPLAELHKVASRYLDCYGLFVGEGAWKGITEHAYMLTVVLSDTESWKAYDLAKEYKYIYEQEAVLVTCSPVNAVLV